MDRAQGLVRRHRLCPSGQSLELQEVGVEPEDSDGASTTTRDDLAVALPRSDGVVWVSDRNIERPADRQLPRQSDVWLMSGSGRRQERLTFFNDPKSDHYLGEALIDDLAWNPEGDKLLLHVVGAPGTDSVDEAIYLVEFDGAL